jgi:hypothetical protein
LSRATSGAGATTEALNVAAERVLACATSGLGATAPSERSFTLRLAAEFNSGVGATTRGAGKVGISNLARIPSAGGGPGSGLKASKFAT